VSTYKAITKHPQTGNYELAEWHDDYYGTHIYGVEFHDKVYPADIVEQKKIYDFWVDDVVAAFKIKRPNRSDEDTEIINFLNEIQRQYERRWKDDPKTGNGATEKSKVLKKS